MQQSKKRKGKAKPEIAIRSTDHSQETMNFFILKFLIIQCALPFRLIECEGFKTFMDYMSRGQWVKITRRYLTPRITLIYNEMIKRLKAALFLAKWISLTLDMWTDRRNRAFMGITAHYIADGFTNRSYVIGFKKLSGSHTADVIVNELKNVIDKFDIKSKLVRIVTDNGANVVKAMRLFTESSNELYNDDPKDLADLSEDFKEVSFSDEEEDEDDYEDEEEGENVKDWDNIFEQAATQCGQNGFVYAHLRCYGHTMQMVIRDSLKGITSLGPLMKKCFTFAQKTHNIRSFCELIEKNKFNDIPKFCVSRWDSELHTIRGVAKLYSDASVDAIEKILENNDLHNLKLRKGQKEVLDNIVDILSPFEYATELLQGQEYCTISHVAPTILELLRSLDCLETKYVDQCKFSKSESSQKVGSQTTSTTAVQLIKALRNNLRKRFAGM